MKVTGILYLYRDEFSLRAWEGMCEAHNLPTDVQVIRIVYNEISGDVDD